MKTTKSLLWSLALVIIPVIGIIVTGLGILSVLLTDQPCPTEGCRIVGSYAAYGEISIIVMGMFFFCVLELLALCIVFKGSWIDGLNRILKRMYIIPEKAMGILLTAAFAIEGYLVAFQVYVADAACLFCLTIFNFLILILICYGMTISKTVATACCAVFLTVFCGVAVVNPAGASTVSDLSQNVDYLIQKGNASETFYLIYDNGCTHCEDVIEYYRIHILCF